MFITYKEGMIDDKSEFTDAKTKEFIGKFIRRLAEWLYQVATKSESK